LKFAFIYALPGFSEAQSHRVTTAQAHFFCVAIPITDKVQAIQVAKDLVEKEGVQMIELCGGLADASLVAKVKTAVKDQAAVGAVHYGPESRRFLVDLLQL
jgi:hypothetical protein